MKKQNLKSLQLRKKVISEFKVKDLTAKVGGATGDPCSGDTAPVYSCHQETCMGPPK
ncbi:hypothetical protein KORDIASMS9_01007 [Kordia sp. SMS9]|uniref:hypothetical protein n=1 Tax=Kordia sp. SMS9 TaxID=2282170 RepID=UPI000E102E98|nr:hypothetical protein [Kordia sp. SMS9]AXG68791.1 hypothetical protein KORDIASMS9_01007 [Kordia sp. SMS9]